MKTIRGSLWTVLLFYILIAFEFFYMASPFAAYFYAVYRPGLNFLNHFPSISWITGFFMPHLVEATRSPVLNFIKSAGVILALSGITTFLICAFQVYYSKLYSKKVVTGGLYKIIRHPQYTAFAICSFGLLLLWPRYLVLIMFISLLFIYYMLARIEEKECEVKFGDTYKKYKESTYMFLPVNWEIFNILSNIKINRFMKMIIIACVYMVTIYISIQLAHMIKRSSVKALYSIYDNDKAYLSVFKKQEDMMNMIREIADSSTIVDSVYNNSSNNKFLNYILPADMYISEIPMAMPDSALCHVYNKEYNSKVVKVIYTKANFVKNRSGSFNIFLNTLTLDPFLEIWIDMEKKSVLKTIKLTGDDIKYKNIPEPVF